MAVSVIIEGGSHPQVIPRIGGGAPRGDAVPAGVEGVTNADPAGLLPARQQMALSLGWHIILACFGVAFPAMIFVMHLASPTQP